MARGAGAEFFRAKREWSKRKDNLLEKYLPQYLPKVAYSVKRPILVVEGFAGPGKFEDESLGSPLIILNAIEKARLGHLPVAISACFVEKDADLFARLKAETGPRLMVKVMEGPFLHHLPEIEQDAAGKTIFLYLDPFTVEGLEWAALDGVFALVGRGVSVEVLLNFNADSFARRGLAVLKQTAPNRKPGEEDIDPFDPETPPSLTHLNAIVGGEWWQPILRDTNMDYPQKVAAIRDGICGKLRARFKEVAFYDVKDHYADAVPKYSLIFASRSSVALMLMNDAMASSREMEVEATKSEIAGGLFGETRPTTLVPTDEELRQLILRVAEADYIPRSELVCRVVRARIGAWTDSRIRREVKEMVKAKVLASESGNLVLNDTTGIRRQR